jgi:hypothetical protein
MISAKIIADSINPRGVRITTYELIYPRIIHGEFMTHRQFSRNAASSRAIPVKAMLDLIEKDPAMPVHWGMNQPGMQAEKELDENTKEAVKALWLEAARQAVSIARVMDDMKVHKQVVNRITEPFQHMRTVMTTTEKANWYWLRDHKDADPTIAALAYAMKVAEEASEPEYLEIGQWHVPYVKTEIWYNRDFTPKSLQSYYDENGVEITLEQALKISASCCAQSSFRKAETSLEKAENVFSRLIESEPVHASPVEHQAMCFDDRYYWPDGVTHRDKEGVYWSGNFRDWIQYRQLIPNNAKH